MIKSPLNDKQWLNITQIHELVKHEGDAACERAFDDLIAAHNELMKVASSSCNSCGSPLPHERVHP